jgi:hypothetical protein
MPDLCKERRDALRADDLVMLHGSVQGGNENARLSAGVREDLQQLLLGDRHKFLQAKKYPLKGGF